MVHGEHWEALFGDVQKMSGLIPRMIREGNPVPLSDDHKQHIELHPEEKRHVLLEYSETPIRYLSVIQKNPDNTSELVSAYPFIKDGIQVVLEVVNLLHNENEDEFESVIECIDSHGVTLSFFDPLFCCNWKTYAVGRKFEFSVAALAYLLEKVKDTMITITEGPAIELEKQRVLEENPNADVGQINTVDISIAELRMLIPHDNNPMNAEYQTVVEKVTYFYLEEIEICRLHVLFRLRSNCELRAILYASEHVLKGFRPQIGDTIRGVLWLQGYPLKSVEDPESWAGRNREDLDFLSSIEADKELSDLHIGVLILVKSLMAAGWDVTRYGNYRESPSIPACQIERGDRQINIWVRSYIQDQEPECQFTQDEMQHYQENSRRNGQDAVCIVVVCKDIGSGYTFKLLGMEHLETITGPIPTLLYKQKKMSQ